MKIVLEESISVLILEALEQLKQNWKIEEWQDAIDNPNIIEDVINEPHKLIDSVNENGTRCAIIMPAEPGTLFILDKNLHEEAIANYAGGTIGGSDPRLNADDLISIIVEGNETITILELRIVHELLHGLDLPADDLHDNADNAFSLTTRWLYSLLKLLGVAAEHMPFFQRRFYKWLLGSRQIGN